MFESGSENKINPQVSVIIPFFNREEFLGEAIESVLAQTEKDWELLLINDGSTDQSEEIAQGYQKDHSGTIRLFCHEGDQNKGASASRDLGIKKANGRYIAFLDSDDVFFPDAIERQLKAFKNNPDADGVCGTLECWYSWSAAADRRDKDFVIDLVLETERLYQPPDLLVHNLKAGGRKPGINCVMLRRDFANKFKVFEDEYNYAGEDQVFWAKVTLHGKIYAMNAVLAKYRQHPASTCAVESENGRDIHLIRIFLDWLEAYLRSEKVDNRDVWKALRGFQKVLFWEIKLRSLKQIYRRAFPLQTRYKIRDKWTKMKTALSRSAHGHK